MPDPQIFKATYSGVPVYEMMCKGVAVMRRRQDGWLNATQILKVAGFDKPQRTRVLERDVQKGEHEKVQGGYGKYQGTWIPPERGMALAKQYNCEHILKPIIEFQPEAKSPPLAPKHAVGPIPGRPAAARRLAAGAEALSSARNARRGPPEVADDVSIIASEDETESRSSESRSSTSPTPSPIQETPDQSMYDSVDEERQSGLASPLRRRGRKARRDESSSDKDDGVNGTRDYCDEILEYFISDSNQIPQFLINPPPDFDPNMIIDDDGHTPLHWAAAMGRIRVVKLLLTAGADIFRVNKSGQTALMRSVMFANNYDVRKFPELYELLHRSTLNIDNYNRTVFHHIVDIAMSKGKTHAARYYMETILQRLAEYPKELADIINFQDEDGETALTMAARCRSKRLVKLLLDHGADPKIMNRDFKSTEDYILEDERFRSSPVLPSRTTNMSYRNLHAAYPALSSDYSRVIPSDKPPLHHSATAQIASTRCVNDMAIMLESLAQSFDQELKDKERDMAQAQSLLGSIQSEILESQRSVAQLKQQSQGYEATEESLVSTVKELKEKMARMYKAGWNKWLAVEEERERAVRATPAGQKLPKLPEDVEMDSIAGSSTPEKGADKMHVDENISDLEALYSDLPTDEESLKRACASLRGELQQLSKDRVQKIDQLVELQTESGTSEKMNQYRRLIGAGCGGLSPDDVDQVVGILLETLEAEEPTASSLTWTSQPGQSVMAVS